MLLEFRNATETIISEDCSNILEINPTRSFVLANCFVTRRSFADLKVVEKPTSDEEEKILRRYVIKSFVLENDFKSLISEPGENILLNHIVEFAEYALFKEISELAENGLPSLISDTEENSFCRRFVYKILELEENALAN
jgi:hypothetical protein